MYKTLLDSQKSVLDTLGETSIFKILCNPVARQVRRSLRGRQLRVEDFEIFATVTRDYS